MNIVFCTIRKAPEYPWEAIQEGIRKCGDNVFFQYPPDDIVINNKTYIITWNCYGKSGERARKHREKGGVHIVMENGYFPSRSGVPTYSLNFDDHIPPVDSVMRGSNRLDYFDVELKPFRTEGDYIIICGQRGGDYSPLSMPKTWPDEIIAKIREITDKKIIYKPHPAKPTLPKKVHQNLLIVHENADLIPLIRGASVCVVYTSNSATLALMEGVPVIYQGERILCKNLASFDISNIKNPFIPSDDLRYKVFNNIAWKQWSLDELSSGEAWRYITYRSLKNKMQ